MTIYVNDNLDNIHNSENLEFLKDYITQFNCYIAGGCFKDLLKNEIPKDIDLFFKNEEDFKNTLSLMQRSSRFEYRDESGYAYTFFDTVNQQTLQIINKYHSESAEKLINGFDFTVSKFAMYMEKSKIQILRDENFFEDLRNKTLSITGDIQFPIGTLKRAFRYVSYGFNITPETIKKIAVELVNTDPDSEEGLKLFYEEEGE